MVELRNVAKDIWQSMNEDEKTGVRFGLFPAAKMKLFEQWGFTARDSAVALMDCAKTDGGMRE